MALGALQQITGSDMETLIQAVCKSSDLQGVKTLISTERVEGQRLRVIEPYKTAKKKKKERKSKVAHPRPWKGPRFSPVKEETLF